MEIVKKEIKEVVEIIPKKYLDSRGCFYETFSQNNYSFLKENFKQDNISISKKNVLRGLHFQAPPFAQGKLVQVLSGKGLDVVVDLRKQSPTFRKHIKIILDAELANQLWIPPGLAHGFLALEENTILSYKCTEFYNVESECTIYWNDPKLNIDWGIENPIISKKDQKGESFTNFENLF